jgi:hypothetical protein
MWIWSQRPAERAVPAAPQEPRPAHPSPRRRSRCNARGTRLSSAPRSGRSGSISGPTFSSPVEGKRPFASQNVTDPVLAVASFAAAFPSNAANRHRVSAPLSYAATNCSCQCVLCLAMFDLRRTAKASKKARPHLLVVVERPGPVAAAEAVFDGPGLVPVPCARPIRRRVQRTASTREHDTHRSTSVAPSSRNKNPVDAPVGLVGAPSPPLPVVLHPILLLATPQDLRRHSHWCTSASTGARVLALVLAPAQMVLVLLAVGNSFVGVRMESSLVWLPLPSCPDRWSIPQPPLALVVCRRQTPRRREKADLLSVMTWIEMRISIHVTNDARRSAFSDDVAPLTHRCRERQNFCRRNRTSDVLPVPMLTRPYASEKFC